MTQVEHFALSLVFYALVGFQIGVGRRAGTDQEEGKKTKHFDIVFLFGFFVGILYGFLGFEFIGGRYFIWLLGLISACIGYQIGYSLAVERYDKTFLPIMLIGSGMVPVLYHYVLS